MKDMSYLVLGYKETVASTKIHIGDTTIT